MDLWKCPTCGTQVAVGKGGVYCPKDINHLHVIFEVVR